MFPWVIGAFTDATTSPEALRMVMANVSRPRPGSPASTAVASNVYPLDPFHRPEPVTMTVSTPDGGSCPGQTPATLKKATDVIAVASKVSA